MGWSIGFDPNWQRDVGYGVPAVCDHPDCAEGINRGLGFVCGSDAYGGEHGCGLFFCSDHLQSVEVDGEWVRLCERCEASLEPFDLKPDVAEWVAFKLADSSWEQWRQENAGLVEEMRRGIECER